MTCIPTNNILKHITRLSRVTPTDSDDPAIEAELLREAESVRKPVREAAGKGALFEICC